MTPRAVPEAAEVNERSGDARQRDRGNSRIARPSSGLLADADGQYVSGHDSQHPRRNGGLYTGSNRRGRGGLLGRHYYWIVARRGSDKAGWPHSNFRGLWSNRRHRAARAPSGGGSVRVDSRAGAHRVLFRRYVHCRRELAECRRELRKQGTDSKHLRHDGIAGRHMWPASSSGDGSSGLQGVLHHRLHYFACACADRFDPGRSAGASRRGQPYRPEQALSGLASRGRSGILEWSDDRRLLHARPDLCRGAGSEHRSDSNLHGVRDGRRIRGGMAPRAALGSLRPPPCHHRRGRGGGRESHRHARARAGRRLSVAALSLRRSVRRNDHTDLQLGARSSERRGRARGDGRCLRRTSAGARRRGRSRPFDRGICHVGHAARPVLHTRCGAGPHRRFSE